MNETDGQREHSPRLVEWCGNARFTEDRELTRDECGSVRRLGARLQLLGGVALSASIGSVALAWLASTQLERHGLPGFYFVMFVVAAAFLAVLWLVFDADSPLHRGFHLLQDARAGRVKVFRAIDTEAVKDDTPHRGETEVLPHSRRIWKIDGATPLSLPPATIAEVADVPEIAGIAAQWLTPIENDADVVGAGQRNLSSAERHELARFARRSVLRPLPWAIVLTLYVCYPAVVPLLHGSTITFAEWAHARSSNILLDVTAIFADIALILGWLRAHGIKRDIEEDYVIIVQVTPDKPNSTAQEGDVLEILPGSHHTWTRNGIPAEWRRTTA